MHPDDKKPELSIEDRVKSLEARVPHRTPGHNPEEIPLHVLNKKAREAWAEASKQLNEAAEKAHRAIDSAFKFAVDAVPNQVTHDIAGHAGGMADVRARAEAAKAGKK